MLFIHCSYTTWCEEGVEEGQKAAINSKLGSIFFLTVWLLPPGCAACVQHPSQPGQPGFSLLCFWEVRLCGEGEDPPQQEEHCPHPGTQERLFWNRSCKIFLQMSCHAEAQQAIDEQGKLNRVGTDIYVNFRSSFIQTIAHMSRKIWKQLTKLP